MYDPPAQFMWIFNVHTEEACSGMQAIGDTPTKRKYTVHCASEATAKQAILCYVQDKHSNDVDYEVIVTGVYPCSFQSFMDVKILM